MKNISYTGYTIVKSAFRLFLGLTLAAFLLCGCGRGSSGPTVRPGTTDEMWGNEVDEPRYMPLCMKAGSIPLTL